MTDDNKTAQEILLELIEAERVCYEKLQSRLAAFRTRRSVAPSKADFDDWKEAFRRRLAFERNLPRSDDFFDPM